MGAFATSSVTSSYCSPFFYSWAYEELTSSAARLMTSILFIEDAASYIYLKPNGK